MESERIKRMNLDFFRVTGPGVMTLDEFLREEDMLTDLTKNMLQKTFARHQIIPETVQFYPEDPDDTKRSIRHTVRFPFIRYKTRDGSVEWSPFMIKEGGTPWSFQYTYVISQLCREIGIPDTEEIYAWGDTRMIGKYYAFPSLENILREKTLDIWKEGSKLIFHDADAGLRKKLNQIIEGDIGLLNNISLTREEYEDAKQLYSKALSSTKIYQEQSALDRLVEEIYPELKELQRIGIDRMNEFNTGITKHQHEIRNYGNIKFIDNYFLQGMNDFATFKILPYLENFAKKQFEQEITLNETFKEKFVKTIIPRIYEKTKPIEMKSEDQALLYTCGHGDIKNMFVSDDLSTAILYDCQPRCINPLFDYAALISIPGFWNLDAAQSRIISGQAGVEDFYKPNLEKWLSERNLTDSDYPKDINGALEWCLFMHTLREGAFADPDFDTYERRHYSLVLKNNIENLKQIYSKDETIRDTFQALQGNLIDERMETMGYPFPAFYALTA